MRPPISTAILLVALACCEADVEYDGWLNVRLQHALGPGGAYTDRGNVTIRSLRSGSSVLEQASPTPSEIDTLKELSRRGDFYKLKSIVQSSDGREDVFLSSMKSRTLLENRLRDTITIWVVHDGVVAAVGVSPAVTEPDAPDDFPASFSSRVFIHHVEQAPVPDTASYIQKLEREREAREKGESKDNRSFLAKYWMYIVPAVIFILISGAANPEQAATR